MPYYPGWDMAEAFILKDIKVYLSQQNIVEKCNFLAVAGYELISYKLNELQ